MKRTITILTALLISAMVWAQTPQKMTYQAIVRDAVNNLVTNTEVGLQIKIVQGTETGTVIYQEVQTPTTNVNGLLTVEIGGAPGFDAIDWENGPYYIKTEIDPLGGTDYTITGVTQLLAVPYALHAKTAEYVKHEVDGDATNEIQNLSDVLAVSNDGNAKQIKNIADPTDAQDAATKNYVDQMIQSQEKSAIKTGTLTGNFAVTRNNSSLGFGNGTIANWRSHSHFITFESDPVFTAWDKSYFDLINKPSIVDTVNAVLDTTTQFVRNETDPEFAAWDKTTGISITESQISDLQHFTTADETDPVYSAWNKSYTDLTNKPAIADTVNDVLDTTTQFVRAEVDPEFNTWDKSSGISITESQISDLQHFTTADETDPVYSTSVASGITESDTMKWNNNTGYWQNNNSNLYYENGLIGIGTTGPTEKLHIVGNNSYEGTTIIRDNNDRPSILLTGSFPNIILGSNGNANHGSTLGFWNYDGSTTTYQWNMGGGQNGKFSIGFTTNSQNPHCGINGYTDQCPNAITPFLINTNGYIGFGTINPNAHLDINVSQNEPIIQNVLNFSGTSGGVADIASFQYDNGISPYPLILNMNPQGDYNRPFVITGGNVGIGITNPEQKLSVAGTIESTSGGVKFPDGTVQTTAASSFLPPGMIVPFAGDAAHVPAGWMLCDGSAISRTTYSSLFAVIGTNYGYGDNSTTFNLPDLRGTFLRGVDGGSGNDPDADSRVAGNAGGNTGNNVGSMQVGATGLPNNPFITDIAGEHQHDGITDKSGNHVHDGSTNYAGLHNHYPMSRHETYIMKYTFNPNGHTAIGINRATTSNTERAGNHAHTFVTNEGGEHTHSFITNLNGRHQHSITAGGDTETRPVNVYVNYIIKL